MLDARERRAARQSELQQRFRGQPLLCFTMNIAGEIKNSSLIRFAFMHGVNQLKKLNPIHTELYHEPTGNECYMLFNLKAETLKEKTVLIEDGTKLGRLFDMDVLDASHTKVGRKEPRKCLICSQNAAECARSRAHGIDAIQTKTNEILKDFAAELLARAAVDALKEEVCITPKPGLVDRNNNGAHRDMNIELFFSSADCLQPFFVRAAQLGLKGDSDFDSLRAIGIEAECAMLKTTGGVNTHKGANYSMLLLLCAIADLLANEKDSPFEKVKELAWAGHEPLNTHGAAMKQQHGAFGVIGEARTGFCHARRAVNYLKNMPAHLVLLHIISELDDTNVLYRGGIEASNRLKAEAKRILTLPQSEQHDAIIALDEECIRSNISAGGAADMLALALFLSNICGYITIM
ncbi:MAG: citrate lyase holo-[acyl-carrier protein] synthase [Clostridia bacterium]|nr:citrate lyase holo-[acyl-carrier protein] synthase [Clostridia bacterium]